MPNTAGTEQIVFIMTDTQRWDMLNCYRNTGLKTPALDRLAAEGMRFDRAYTCQPVCGPARSALFTGMYPHSNGAWANSMPLGDNVKTIGQRLRDRGIHTAYVGKWHLDGGDYFGLGNCPDGWDPDYWYDMRSYLQELGPDERLLSRKPQSIRSPGVEASFTYGHRVSNRARDFLEKYSKERFFLVVSYDEPHHPFLCPEPYASMYDGYEFPKSENVYDSLEDKPDYQRAWAGDSLSEDKNTLTVEQADFFGCNSFVDAEIGRVLEAVERYAPGAMVIFTSDHGDFLHSHSLFGKGPAVYDEISRIPLIIRQPECTVPGSVCKTPVSHIDLMPTIMEAMGLEIPVLLEGGSLVGLLHGEGPAARQVFMEFGRYEIDHDGFGGFQPLRAVFDGRYKLSVNLLSTDELYDLETDPGEMVNLIERSEYAEIRDRLHDAVLEWMNRTRDPFRGYYWERRPWRRKPRPASWEYTAMTRQREHEEYEPRQLDYDTGLEMEEAVRPK